MQKRLLPALLAFLILLSSCRSYRHIYSPSPPNNPYLLEKGDAEAGIYYSGGDGNNGAGERKTNEGMDFQGAYAVTNKFAVTGSFNFRKEKDEYINFDFAEFFDSSMVKYKRSMVEIGAGYFERFNKRKTSVVNLFAGIGFGKAKINDRGLDSSGAIYTRFHELKLTRLYLQPGYQFWMSDYLTFGLVLKASFNYYSGIRTSYNSDELKYFEMDELKNKIIYSLEPATSIRFGIPGVKWLKGEGVFSFVLFWPGSYAPPRGVNGSVGLIFDIGDMINKNAAR